MRELANGRKSPLNTIHFCTVLCKRGVFIFGQIVLLRKQLNHLQVCNLKHTLFNEVMLSVKTNAHPSFSIEQYRKCAITKPDQWSETY